MKSSPSLERERRFENFRFVIQIPVGIQVDLLLRAHEIKHSSEAHRAGLLMLSHAKAAEHPPEPCTFTPFQ